MDKAKKSEYNRKYYNKNKVKILSQLKNKITCECGAIISKGNIATHKKTKKHHKSIQMLLRS